jgi:hypothetical protein
VTIDLLVMLIVLLVAAGFAAMTVALWTPLVKMVRSGSALRLSQGLLLGLTLVAGVAIMIAIAVVLSRM